MPIDFSLPPRVHEWQKSIRAFVDDVVIPREQDAFAHGHTDELRIELQAAARDAGVWAP